MDKNLVLKFVTMPMAIKIFNDDKESFKVSKTSSVYLDLLDSILKQLEKDFKQLKADMFTKHHLDVKRLGKSNRMVRYRVNKDVIEFSPGELRNKTKELMEEYIATVEVEKQERVWKINN